MRPTLDDRLSDPVLREEIALLGEVMVAAAGARTQLSAAQVDAVLGVGFREIVGAA